jgi:thioredoxin-dependent peroxiredoxin
MEPASRELVLIAAGDWLLNLITKESDMSASTSHDLTPRPSSTNLPGPALSAGSPVSIDAVAPDFELSGLALPTFRLADLRGKKVLLSFLRNAQCAVCNLWVATTMRRAPQWRAAGLEVVAIFESTVEKLAVQFEGHVPSFAVLADPDGALHETFRSRTDLARVTAIAASPASAEALARAARAGFAPRHEEGANFFRLPSEILIREDGTVALIHVSEEVSNHLDPEVVTRFARGELASPDA